MNVLFAVPRGPNSATCVPAFSATRGVNSPRETASDAGTAPVNGLSATTSGASIVVHHVLPRGRAIASDPGGFGPSYPVILATQGPLAGQYIYYGHVAAAVVKVGQHVIAGQPIAIMGHTGNAVSLGHGHIEIGFSDGSGAPLNHHSALAITPSGAAMRQVLTDISAAFKIRNS